MSFLHFFACNSLYLYQRNRAGDRVGNKRQRGRRRRRRRKKNRTRRKKGVFSKEVKMGNREKKREQRRREAKR